MQNLSSLSPREKTTNTVIYGFCVAMLGLGLSVILTGRDKRALCQEELMTGILISSVGMLSLSGMSVRRQTNNHAKIEAIMRCILCAGMAILTGLALSGVKSAEVILRSLAVVASLSCVGKAAEVVGRRIASDIQSMREGCWRLNEKVLEVAEGVSNNITEVKEVVVNNITGISGVVVSGIIELKELEAAAVKTCKAATDALISIQADTTATCKDIQTMSTTVCEFCEDITPQFRIAVLHVAEAKTNVTNFFKSLPARRS